MSDVAEPGPARNALTVTTHDTNALTPGARSLFVGTAGNITLRPLDGSDDVVFKNVPAGTLLPVRASHIRATGTTAADILALY